MKHFWISQYPYNSHIFRDIIYQLIISCDNFFLIIYQLIISCHNFSSQLSRHNFCNQPRFGRFHEDFTLPFTLSFAFPSLSLSPLYPFHLSLSIYLSLYLSLSLSISLSIFLISPSLSISLLLPFFLPLFSLSFSLAYLMDAFVLVIHIKGTLNFCNRQGALTLISSNVTLNDLRCLTAFFKKLCLLNVSIHSLNECARKEKLKSRSHRVPKSWSLGDFVRYRRNFFLLNKQGQKQSIRTSVMAVIRLGNQKVRDPRNLSIP